MKLLNSFILVSAVAATGRHECEQCPDTSCGDDQLQIGESIIERPHCDHCTEYQCEDCESCPGKRSVTCEEGEKVAATGTFRTNCDKKCKVWECVGCDACDDIVEECATGFHGVKLGDRDDCECDQTGEIFGCECTPCESTGPEKGECGEDEYHVKDAFFDECGDKCFDRSCQQCESCDDTVPECTAEEYVYEDHYHTDDCDKECSAFSCQSCSDYCPNTMECPEGQIAQARACEGEECDDNCSCDVLECRECVACEDDMPECAAYDMPVHVNSTYGECGDECGIYECECAAPCADEEKPDCGEDARLKSKTITDDCGNECKTYECFSYNPLDHLDDFKAAADDMLASLFGESNAGWVSRMSTTYGIIADKAGGDYEKKNAVCHYYGVFEEEVEEEAETAEEERGLPEVCQDDARQVRRVARFLRTWSEEFNKPCGDREGEDPVYHNKLVTKINKWRQKVIKKLCN